MKKFEHILKLKNAEKIYQLEYKNRNLTDMKKFLKSFEHQSLQDQIKNQENEKEDLRKMKIKQQALDTGTDGKEYYICKILSTKDRLKKTKKELKRIKNNFTLDLKNEMKDE